MERQLKQSERVLLQERDAMWASVAKEVHEENRKTIEKFKRGKQQSNLIPTSDEEELLGGPMVLTPPSPERTEKEEDSDGEEPEVEAEIVDDDEIKTVLAHKQRGGEILVRVEFFNEEKDWIHLCFALFDAEERVAEYAKRKALKGDVWKRGIKEGKRIVNVIDGRGKGKHQELQVLWNNGYSEWKRYPTVLRIAPDQVKEYLDRDKE